MKKLPREFYNRDTVIVAKELLGKYLVHRYNGLDFIGRIVEVEAYLGPHDLAAHSAKGLTPRTKVMFGPPGYAYVYLIYGMYHCMNVVTQQEGHASAVLLRALEPIQTITGRTQGPGLLCNAMHINKTLNGHDLLSNQLYIAEPPISKPVQIVKRPRIGVAYAAEWAHKPYIPANFIEKFHIFCKPNLQIA
jgi:DNA-3-methyladenine glycosylase